MLVQRTDAGVVTDGSHGDSGIHLGIGGGRERHRVDRGANDVGRQRLVAGRGTERPAADFGQAIGVGHHRGIGDAAGTGTDREADDGTVHGIATFILDPHLRRNCHRTARIGALSVTSHLDQGRGTAGGTGQLEFHRAGIGHRLGAADDRGDLQGLSRRVGNELPRDPPGGIGWPIVDTGELQARLGFPVPHPQRMPAGALDHAELPQAVVEVDQGRGFTAVGVQFDPAGERLPVHRQVRAALGSEENAPAVPLHQAQPGRTLRQAHAAVAAAAHVVGVQLDPVQADQPGPAVRRHQALVARCTPGILLRSELHAGGGGSSDTRLRLRTATALAAAGQGERQQRERREASFPDFPHCYRPLMNQRSISPSPNRAQVGRP